MLEPSIQELEQIELENKNLFEACDFSTMSLDAFSLYMQDIRNIPLLSEEEEKHYGMLLKQGSTYAKEILIKSNLRLVVYFVLPYSKAGYDVNELIQEGNLGLIRAAEKFDVDKGYKFSTYAFWWIRQGITRSIANNAHTIRFPVYVSEYLCKIRKSLDTFKNNGCIPTLEDISRDTNIPIEKIQEIFSFPMPKAVSLNEPLADDEDYTLATVLEDERADVYHDIEHRELYHELLDALNLLPDRQREILLKRYPLDGSKPQTLEDIGKEYGLTRERIRQIETGGLKKIRYSGFTKGLRHYYE